MAYQLDYQYPLYDEKISNYVIRQKKNMALKMITNKIFSIEKIYFDYSILKN